MCDNGQDPRDRVGNVQREQRVIHTEHGEDPDDAEHARADHGHEHRHDRIAKAAHHARADIHHAAQEICHADHAEALNAVGDDLRVLRIDVQQRIAQTVCALSEHDADEDDEDHAAHEDAVYAAVLLRAEVLACEAERGLVERVHRDVHEALHVRRRRVASDRNCTEAVDGRLNEHVRDVEDNALHTGGQSDLHDLRKAFRVEPQAAYIQMTHAVRAGQTQHGQRRGDALAEHGRERHACHAHAKHAHEQQVAQHIHHACRHQKVQRPPRIAHRTQHRRAEVIDHGRGHADKVHAHVQHRALDDLIRGFHQRQHGPREHDAEHDQDNTADQTGEQRGLHGLLHAVVVFLAAVPRHEHVRAHRNADKGIDEQIEQRGRRADRRHRIRAGELADNDNIRRIEQQLEYARQQQRQREDQYAAQQRTARHIHFIRFSHSFLFFS